MKETSVSFGIYDKEEIHKGCTVQVWSSSVTGEVSIGWWRDEQVNEEKLKRGSIIQANENAKDWCGTVLIVDEVKPWGCQAFVHVPTQGDAYIRLNHDQYDILGGEATLMPGLSE